MEGVLWKWTNYWTGLYTFTDSITLLYNAWNSRIIVLPWLQLAFRPNFGSLCYSLSCDCDINTCLDVLVAGYVCHFMLFIDCRLATTLVCAGRWGLGVLQISRRSESGLQRLAENHCLWNLRWATMTFLCRSLTNFYFILWHSEPSRSTSSRCHCSWGTAFLP